MYKLSLSGFWLNSDPRPCFSNEGKFFLFYWINILNNLSTLFFVLYFLVSDVLCKPWSPGSGPNFTGSVLVFLDLGHLLNVWHRKNDNIKEGFYNHLKYIYYKILKISLLSSYRAPEPGFCGKKITESETLPVPLTDDIIATSTESTHLYAFAIRHQAKPYNLTELIRKYKFHDIRFLFVWLLRMLTTL